MARAFVIRPFNTKKDSTGREIDFEEVHTKLIKPALEEAGLAGSTTGEIIEGGNIREDMFSLILEADVVICDISLHNANVFYELGIRHALRRRHTILIREKNAADSPPFDLLTDRYLKYSLGSADSTSQLFEMIRAVLRSNRDTDSPIFKMLPNLPEADPSSVQVLPVDFREEVDRARAAKSKGWLRLLAQDVQGRRFQWAGLELVGKTQWDLKDYAGSRDTWEAIREIHPANVNANLALANIYERLSREMDRLHLDEIDRLLNLSDQAIDRVLANPDAHSRERVEARALQGRNQKTRWRTELSRLPTVEERRQAAMNESLRRSYAAYEAAFEEDLNHHWSGLAALQMGTIFLDLSQGGDGMWKTAFDDDAQAETYHRTLAQDVVALRHIVAASVKAALLRLAPTDPDRVWAEISNADVLFLTEESFQRVVSRYKDALTGDKLFAWDAARGQLQLFAQLGVRAECAEKVIQVIDGQLSGSESKPERQPSKPLHVILFAGHRVDAPNRQEPRFPPQQAERAKSLIADTLKKLGEGYELLGLASGASGSDILFHEACTQLAVRSILCLPIRADRYAAEEFKALDDWRSRFLTVCGQREVRELSDREVLPRWLQGAPVNAWERGNRWVLQMALASGSKVSLLAVWDGKTSGDDLGGTAHMVQLAREAGTIDVTVLNSTALR